MTEKPANIKTSRIKLLLVALLFLGPLAAAFIWYYGFGAILAPKSQSNHAPLISPVVTLQNFSNLTLNGEQVDSTIFERKWTIVHILDVNCDDACKNAIYNTRQTRIAVGRDLNRIQRIIVVDDEKFASEVALNHSDAVILFPDEMGIEKQIVDIPAELERGINDAVLIDPLGNAMMIIPETLDPSLLLKDMKKLLKLSHIG